MRHRLFVLILLVFTVGLGESSGQHQHTEESHSVSVSSHRLKNLTGRFRRRTDCPKKSDYKPWGKDYCCNKCTRGHYKKADCSGPTSRTECEECKPGTFVKFENSVEKCFSCRVCDTVLHQIELRACTIYTDTVCGCPKGMFQIKIDSTTFYCKNCTSCLKAVLRDCIDYNDTICHCENEYYYHPRENKCQPCHSCDPQSDCDRLCRLPVTTGTDTSALLILAVVSCSAMVIGFLFVIGCIGHRRFKRASVPQYHNETGSTSPSELVVGKTQSLLPIQEVAFQPDSGYYSAPCSELPDCVQIAGKTQLPNSSQVNYVIADLVPASRWREFVRRLGMNDHDIERSEIDNRQSFREAQYAMVKIWRDRQGGKGATTEAICKVLKDMDLNGCAEQFQEALQ